MAVGAAIAPGDILGFCEQRYSNDEERFTWLEVWQPGKPTYGIEESQVTLFGMGLCGFKKCAMHCERCRGAVLHEKYFGP